MQTTLSVVPSAELQKLRKAKRMVMRITMRLATASLLACLLAGLLLFVSKSPLSAQEDPPDSVTASEVTIPDIIGGKPAQPGAYPWMVGIVQASYSNAYIGQFCGGSLVAPQWVLTAAHCVDDASAESLDVVIGRHILSSQEGERITVTQVIIHPNYVHYLEGADLALLKIEQSSVYTPIALDIITDTLIEVRALRSTVTGWGRTETNYPDPLYEVSVPLVPAGICNSPDAYNGRVQPDMICAGYQQGDKDSCRGDSGGPLMVPTAQENGWMQVGIVSWGRGCGNVDGYGIYTRLATYNEWVKSCIADPFSAICRGGDAIDTFEPDDDVSMAITITTDGTGQHHNFHLREDSDWMTFDAVQGQYYQIETYELDDNSDTILWLYDGTGRIALAYNDNVLIGNNQVSASRINWTAPQDGKVYVQIENRWKGASRKTGYNVRIAAVQPFYLPIILAE